MKTKLIEKGWTKDEIAEAQSLLNKAKTHDLFFSKIVFWSALFVVVLGNLALSMILIPFLVIFQSWALHVIIIIVALMMGAIYSFLITDIGHLETKHHIAASIIVPVIALINLVVIVLVSNNFAKEIGTGKEPHNQWLVAAIFTVAFILPFLFHRLWNVVRKE